ncbi:hypothetical protein [Streptomyces sp. NBC_00239]|uniref:hypothetical protein n=1 Tax=Streptomyces sp. NBC_00239 TaxID=2903640 RepID=UPI002E2DA555|nr:hypothetical protein [Streptomyces sp. NBC_00239]
MSVETNLLPASVSGISDADGWVAGANTSIIRTTARAYNGEGSLQLTATAAGTVSATTRSYVPVTPGVIYTAYAYAANASSASGRQVTVSIVWSRSFPPTDIIIGTSTSAPLTLPSTGWTTPPPIVIAKAIDGEPDAIAAKVTVTVTGMAAGSSVSIDAIALGPVAQIPGNLLSYAVQGSEVDASGWQPVWNGSVGRTSTTSYEGWYSLQLTATAIDVARCQTVTPVPMSVGVEYVADVWAYLPAGASELRVQIRWQNAAGALLSTSSRPWTGLSPSTWTRCAVIATAPPEATHARVVLEAVATATNQVWTFDQITLRRAPSPAGNLIGYSPASFEVTSLEWTPVANCSRARSTTRAFEGVASLRVTADGGGDATVALNSQPISVVGRQAYHLSPMIYHADEGAPVLVDLQFTWRRPDGSTISTTSVRWSMGASAGWYAPTGSAVAPSDADTAIIGIRFVNPDADTLFYVDRVEVAPGGMGVLAEEIPGAYGARLTLRGLTTGSHTHWGLWRMDPSGTLVPVRGSDGDLTAVPITGDVGVAEDYEAPLGIAVRYYLKLFTGSAYTAATSDPLTLTDVADTEIVLKDPGLPARQTRAVVEGLPSWQRSARQGVHPVRGRSRPVVITDVRVSRTGSMTLVTETQQEIDAMWWLLDTGATLLVQWPRTWGERDVYVQVGDVTEERLARIADYADRRWSLALTEVDRPIGGTAGSADRTWSDVAAEHLDWLSVMQVAATWTDVYVGAP